MYKFRVQKRRRQFAYNSLLLNSALPFFHCEKRPRRWWKKTRSEAFWTEIVPKFTEEDWIKNFRMGKATFLRIVETVYDEMKPDDPSVRIPVSTDKRVAIAIYKLASAAEYRTVGNLFGVSEASVFNFLKRFCDILCKHSSNEIYMPDVEEGREIAARILDKYHFPQVFGCIDGTHVAVRAPIEGKKDYTNQKGWDSLVLQAVVDDKYCFRDISVKMPGSCHDATVFKNSNLFRMNHLLPQDPVLIEGVKVPLLILGDPAYLLPWLLKPYTGSNLSPDKESFNSYLSSVRIIVENSFGRLKARWRIIGKRIDACIDFAPKIIGACCILHNICEKNNSPIDHATVETIIPEQPYCRAVEDNISSATNAIRSALTKHFMNTLPMRSARK